MNSGRMSCRARSAERLSVDLLPQPGRFLQPQPERQSEAVLLLVDDLVRQEPGHRPLVEIAQLRARHQHVATARASTFRRRPGAASGTKRGRRPARSWSRPCAGRCPRACTASRSRACGRASWSLAPSPRVPASCGTSRSRRPRLRKSGCRTSAVPWRSRKFHVSRRAGSGMLAFCDVAARLAHQPRAKASAATRPAPARAIPRAGRLARADIARRFAVPRSGSCRQRVRRRRPGQQVVHAVLRARSARSNRRAARTNCRTARRRRERSAGTRRRCRRR